MVISRIIEFGGATGVSIVDIAGGDEMTESLVFSSDCRFESCGWAGLDISDLVL